LADHCDEAGESIYDLAKKSHPDMLRLLLPSSNQAEPEPDKKTDRATERKRGRKGAATVSSVPETDDSELSEDDGEENGAASAVEQATNNTLEKAEEKAAPSVR
jgi:hypothetical protein